MTQATTTLDVHTSTYQKTRDQLPGHETDWVSALREDAIEAYQRQGWPTTKLEAWKYTNLDPVRKLDHQPAPRIDPGTLEATQLEDVLIEGLDAALVVFVNGRLDPELSQLDEIPDGVTVDPLARVLDEDPDAVEGELGAHAAFDDSAFCALNTASFPDGALVRIHEGQRAERPVHILHIGYAPEAPIVTHPRTLVIAEANSEADVVETYATLGPEATLTNGVTEISTHENSTLRHVKLQRDADTSDHVWTFDATQRRDSTLRAHNLTLGARITRNEVFTTLDAEGCDAVLNGFYFGIDEQHIDNYTRIRHAEPHGDSHQLYKGILDDASRGVFRGTIYVAPDAQRTDGYQHNPNLLLSKDAEANSVPQLEIFADDVKCSHGSTTGEMDDSWLWYMRSRGLSEEQARTMLVYAFANDVLEMIEIEPVRKLAQRVVLDRLPGGDEVRQAL